jgi:hypothetical protein
MAVLPSTTSRAGEQSTSGMNTRLAFRRNPAHNLSTQSLSRLLDDVLVFTSFDGTIASKSDDLLMHRSGRLQITKMDPSDWRLLGTSGRTGGEWSPAT